MIPADGMVLSDESQDQILNPRNTEDEIYSISVKDHDKYLPKHEILNKQNPGVVMNEMSEGNSRESKQDPHSADIFQTTDGDMRVPSKKSSEKLAYQN